MGGEEVEVKCEPNRRQIKTLQLLTATTRKRVVTKKKNSNQKFKTGDKTPTRILIQAAEKNKGFCFFRFSMRSLSNWFLLQ